MDWTDSGADGAYRFLGRVYRFVTRNADRQLPPGTCPGDAKALRKLHQTIRKITDDFETRWHFNTCVAAIMELMNELYAVEHDVSEPVMRDCLRNLVLILHPFAPYVTQELWEELGHNGPVFKQHWPSFDPGLAKDQEAEIVVQVNGKKRATFAAPFGTPDSQLQARALAAAKSWIEGKQIVKIIVVPDKLVNIVVK
jgi:leucyl-tRNA synthetase